MNRIVRQGDVLLIPATVPADARKQERKGPIVLAEGEATGHAHTIVEPDVELYEKDGSMFVRVGGIANVVHQEHNPISLAAGDYLVVRQREYHPAEIRRVAD